MSNPTTLITIIITLAGATAAIVLAIQNNRRKNAVRELNNAARKLVKEQNLSESLRNMDDPAAKRSGNSRRRMRMIAAFEWKDREKESYVFDPAEGIRIGRATEGNNISIPDDEISLNHCFVYQSSGDLVLEDLHSTNGTVVIHGLQKRRIRGRTRIYDGDRIKIGRMELTVHVFWIDTAYI